MPALLEDGEVARPELSQSRLGVFVHPFLAVALLLALGADVSSEVSGAMVTPGGQVARGSLVGMDERGLRWRLGYLRDAVRYPIDSVWQLHLVDPDEDRRPSDVRVRLTTGEVLTGEIVSSTTTGVRLATECVGEVWIPRRLVVNLDRRDAPVVAGPGNAEDWSVLTPREASAWESRSGSFQTKSAGSIVWRDLGLSESRELNLDLEALGSAPAFRIVLGVMDELEWIQDGVFIESWGDRIVVYRELDETLEVHALSPLPSHGGVRLHILWHPNEGVATIKLGSDSVEISLPDDVDDGVALESLAGGLAVHDMRCRPAYSWGDGSASADRSSSVDPPPSVLPTEEPATIENSADVPARPSVPLRLEPWELASLARLTYYDGSVIYADLVGLANDRFTLRTHWSDTLVSADSKGLKQLEIPGVDAVPESKVRFVSSGQAVRGQLVGWDEPSGSLVWKPHRCVAGSPFATDAAGTIELGRPLQSAYSSDPHAIYFSNEDTVPGRVVGITDQALISKTAHGDNVVHDLAAVKAVEFDRELCREYLHADPDLRRYGRFNKRPSRNVIGAKRRVRVLSLPRQLWKRPPTHVLVARSGDLVRGRLLEMSKSHVRFDTGANELRFPVEKLIAIIWLHPKLDGVSGVGKESTTRDAWRDQFPIQLVFDGDQQLSVRPTSIADGLIRGRSLFGEFTKIDLADVRSIRVGSSPERRHRYSDWILAPMPEPFPDR